MNRTKNQGGKKRTKILEIIFSGLARIRIQVFPEYLIKLNSNSTLRPCLKQKPKNISMKSSNGRRRNSHNNHENNKNKQ